MGPNAARAAQLLKEMVFTNVSYMEGGTWKPGKPLAFQPSSYHKGLLTLPVKAENMMLKLTLIRNSSLPLASTE